jgi:hypothetical protein
MTRTDAALDAMRRELERRRAGLDEDDDLISITLTVKFVRGTQDVRGTIYQDERLAPPPGERRDGVGLSVRERADITRR